jgi:hypothetical protein
VDGPPSTVDAELPSGDGSSPALDADPRVCLGTFASLCVEPPQSAITLTTQTIDTATSLLCAAASPDNTCMIVGSSITIPGNQTVTVTGSRPLILLSTGSITISGVLDASSRQAGAGSGRIGAGADVGPCPTNVTSPTVGGAGDAGGGWGGSFGSAGNNGGDGGLSGAGGVAAPAFSPAALRGGCSGGNGAGTGGGAGGHGGGAVLLVANQTLTIDGTVNASGAAGAGGSSTDGGGGGGGSGGMIVLDAATVNTAGKCFANGGGGGEGASVSVDGKSGGHSIAPGTTAAGGKGGADFGGDGGNGGFGATPGGSPGKNGGISVVSGSIQDLGGGGGGGGGGGVIKIFAPQQLNTADPSKVAPPPTPPQAPVSDVNQDLSNKGVEP